MCIPFSDMPGPSTPADYNEIIPNIGSNDRDAYAEARVNILKELTRPSKYHDLDMLERAVQDLTAARDGTDTIPLTNPNFALGNRQSLGYNNGISQLLTSNTREEESPTNPGLPKKPTHGYEWRKELYRTHPWKKANPKLIRSILQYHDFESEGEDNTLEDNLALEKIFGLQDVEWDSDHDRAEEICERAFLALMRYLTKLGYRTFTTASENHRGRLEIRPANHQDPPRLPKWLRIDFLVPCKGIDGSIIPEMNFNNRIQTGAGLWKHGNNSVGTDCSIDAVGTLGPIMKSESNVYFGLTAGHVLPDGDRELVVKTEDGELEANLHVARRYLRAQGRPIGRLEGGDQLGFQDEVILLEIGVQDKDKFNTVLNCVNCHYYKPGNISKEEASDPMAYPREYYLTRAIQKEGPIRVYKLGSATGLTTGHLVSVQYGSPPRRYGRNHGESESDSSTITDRVVLESDSEGTKSGNDDDLKEEYSSDESNDGDEESGDGYSDAESGDDGEFEEARIDWLGKIKWESKENSFSAPGDSGALVYAFERGTVIPLGIHLGSPTSWPLHSVCLSIETFCVEGEKGGFGRLRFAEAPSASEEEEELTQRQLEEKRQVEKEGLEALIRASKFPSPQTTNSEVCME